MGGHKKERPRAAPVPTVLLCEDACVRSAPQETVCGCPQVAVQALVQFVGRRWGKRGKKWGCAVGFGRRRHESPSGGRVCGPLPSISMCVVVVVVRPESWVRSRRPCRASRATTGRQRASSAPPSPPPPPPPRGPRRSPRRRGPPPGRRTATAAAAAAPFAAMTAAASAAPARRCCRRCSCWRRRRPGGTMPPPRLQRRAASRCRCSPGAVRAYSSGDEAGGDGKSRRGAAGSSPALPRGTDESAGVMTPVAPVARAGPCRGSAHQGIQVSC